MTDREICALAIKTFGEKHQLRMLQEECAEVVVDVNHYLRGRIGKDKLCSELADLEIMAIQILKIKQLGAHILADNCGQTYEKVMKDFDRDYWMDANESVAYGIVDGVMSKL